VFNDDDHIMEFLTNANTFRDVVIDDEEHEKVVHEYIIESNEAKSNPVLKGVL